jgi:linoleoyl-CoA desaturase
MLSQVDGVMPSLHFSKPTATHGGFMPTLKSRVNSWVQARGKRSNAVSIVVLRALLWASMTIGCYGLMVTATLPWSMQLVMASLVGCFGLLLGFSIGHDASHSVISRSPTLNRMVHFLSFVTIGIDPMLWRIRHIHSHHIFPNVTGGDADSSENPLLRLSPHQRWRPHFLYQWLYAPAVYAMIIPYAVFFADWLRLMAESKREARANLMTQAKILSSFLAFKALHFGVLIVIPMIVFHQSLNDVLLQYAVITVSGSLLFAVMLVGTHFCTETSFPYPDEAGQLPYDWGVHNLLTACDWNPESWFASFVSGGANAHVAHHLFPNLPNTYYRGITPIIRSTATEYGLPYHSLTLPRMLFSHFRLLKVLSKKPVIEVVVSTVRDVRSL